MLVVGCSGYAFQSVAGDALIDIARGVDDGFHDGIRQRCVPLVVDLLLRGISAVPCIAVTLGPANLIARLGLGGLIDAE